MNFARREILIRDRKGYKDRVTVLPRAIESSLREQLEHARKVHRHDLAAGFGVVWLPYALARKYPRADREWAWQCVFPVAGRSRDTRTGIVRRLHLSDQAFQRAAAGRARCRAHEARDSAHGATLLRDPFAGVRLRYPNRARIARAHRRQHDDDLCPRPQSWRPWCGQPVERRLICDR